MAETRNYKNSKLNVDGAPSQAPNSPLVKAIVDICKPICRDGSTAPFSKVVAEIRKRKVMRITHAEALRELVACAVRDGSVPGFASKRGPGGGIFHIDSYIKEYGQDDYDNLSVSTERAKLGA